MVYSFECRMHVSLHPYFETQPTASGSSALAPLDTLEVLWKSWKISNAQCPASEHEKQQSSRGNTKLYDLYDLHLANGRHPRFCTNPSHWECLPAACWAAQQLTTASNDWHVNPSSGIMLARLKSNSCNWWDRVRQRDGAMEWLGMAGARWH